MVLALPEAQPPLQLCADGGPGGLSELFLDASLECLTLMKKSLICRPVSRRQVWKEFSQVTEALGRVSAGGKCKAVRPARDGLAGVQAEEAEEETECQEKSAPGAKRRKSAEVQPKGRSAGLGMCRVIQPENTKPLPREVTAAPRKAGAQRMRGKGWVSRERVGGSAVHSGRRQSLHVQTAPQTHTHRAPEKFSNSPPLELFESKGKKPTEQNS